MNKLALESLRQQGYTPATMLDVGAHIGTFTQEFLGVFPACIPTLVEPNPFCQADLAKLGFEQHAVAASNEVGTGELFLTKEWLQSTGTSLYRENTAFFRDEVVVRRQIAKTRLDDLFAGRKFDFVKIDTQGSELDVIQGGQAVLRRADYILVEVSLVEYNIGGASAEAIFALLSELGFHCTEVTDFHRLAGVQNGNLLQMDFLFERRVARNAQAASTRSLDELCGLAQTLLAEGRAKDALLLLEHLKTLQPDNIDILRNLARVQGAEGQTLKAMETLAELKAASIGTEELLGEIQVQMPAALERFNAHAAAGEVAQAEKYAAALVVLIPRNAALLDSVLSCNLALGRKQEAAKYASALLSLDPNHSAARASLRGAHQ